MNRRRFFITLIALLALLLTTSGATGQGPDSEGEAHPRGGVSIAGTVNSRISYQGRLLEDDAPVTGSRDMRFRLYSDSSCAVQVGNDIVKNGVTVTDGLFSVELDVSHWDFNGQGLWLEVEVGGTAIGCQEILPVPYALSLRPGANIVGTAQGLSIIYAENESDAQLSKGVHGRATASSGTTFGVLGESLSTWGRGVGGWVGADSGTTYGVWGESRSISGTGVYGLVSATTGETCGVLGRTDSSSNYAKGVRGYASASSGTTYGVYGESVSASASREYGTPPKYGLRGYATASSGSSYGVRGTSSSPSGTGVYGFASGEGVLGESDSPSGIGVRGENTSTDSDSDGIGVQGSSWYGAGVQGSSLNGVGVRGTSGVDDGVYGETWDDGAGVHGVTIDTFGETYGVRGESPSGNRHGYGGYFVGYNGVYGEATNELGYAAVFSGTAQTHVLEITGGSDLSERFDIAAAEGEVTPGLVVCIDPNHPGKLLVCNEAYDRTVAGVVSGAGGIEPGMVMGQQGSPADGAYPVALTGRVYVWADASAGPIQPGDLLTPSDTPGHVMRVSDYAQAQGAIIGKAMSSLDQGQGLILVLVSLQ